MDFEFKNKPRDEQSHDDQAQQNNPTPGWNAEPPRDEQDSTQAGWNVEPPRDAQEGTQAGWNAEPPRDTQDSTQAGWNAEPPRDAQDSTQAGWNAEPPRDTQDSTQAGWNAEPRTPYQTPVRSAQQYASYEQWQRGQQERIAQSPYGEQQKQEGVYSTYEEWQRQQAKKDGAVQEKKPRKALKRVAISLGSVAAACLLIAVGVYAGTQMNGAGADGSVASGTRPVDPSKPSISITDTVSAPSSGQEDGLSGEEIYDKVSPSVVSVVSSSLLAQGQSSGSGVIMSADGYIITNHHVIAGAQKVSVLTADGETYNAEVVGSDEATDLAVLRVVDAQGKTFQIAEFGDSSKIKAGQRAYAIGSPGGVELANTITTGSISAISRDITIDDRVMTLIQTDASINPGNSGGALINKYGQVIGITSAKLGISYYEGLGFAIPIDTTQEIVNQLIQYGHVPGRPAIGISGQNLSEEIAEYNNVPQGVWVRVVDSRSDAAAQGLQPNDIITAVDGKTITTMDEINAAKESLKAGDKMKLTIYRIGNGRTMDITITLSDEYELAQEPVIQQPDTPVESGIPSGGSTFPW